MPKGYDRKRWRRLCDACSSDQDTTRKAGTGLNRISYKTPRELMGGLKGKNMDERICDISGKDLTRNL